MNIFRRACWRINNALRGWRTIAANLLFAIVPVIELTEFQSVLPQTWLPWYVLGVALANMWLRKITTTPIGSGE